MKRVKLIYNPNSGERKILNMLDDIINVYQENKYELIPYRLDNRYPIDKAFIGLDDSYDHLLIAGGDGTIDLILNAMREYDINIPIGILPTGTANDFANALNIPVNVKEAIDNKI